LPGYLDNLAVNYGAGLRVLDFQKSPDPSRVTINNWVSDNTAGKIKDLLPQGSITNFTRLVLTNAIYFKAAWQNPFDKARTQNGTFNLLSGSTVTVPVMKNQESFGYAESDGYQAVELPYDGNQLSMVVLLPGSGKFTNFESSLTAAQLSSILGNLKSNEVNLTMPKFQFDTTLGLKQSLSGLGMTDAFNPTTADFSGIDGKKDLYISDVLHKAFVAVDEAGTEAAAASAVIISTTSMPVNIADVTMDRPFIFLIRDIPTGTILFMGRVMNPAK
jgi:serpin B